MSLVGGDTPSLTVWIRILRSLIHTYPITVLVPLFNGEKGSTISGAQRCFGSESGLDPDSIESVDPDWE